MSVEYTGEGIALKSLNLLEKYIAENTRINNSIAAITGDNEGSIKLFSKCGYEQCAYYKAVGEKFGKLQDVLAYQKILN